MIINKIKSFNKTINVPSDKSILIRSILFASIADGISHIEAELGGEDVETAIKIVRELGVKIEICNDAITVFGVGKYGLKEPTVEIDCGNSATVARLLMGILSAQVGKKFKLSGDSSLKTRPMDRIIKPLKLMGAEILGTSFPLEIIGKDLVGIEYKLDIASAQIKSAILLAGLYASGKTVIFTNAITRDHTERLFLAMGAKISTEEAKIVLEACTLKAMDIKVPGDISSAVFYIVLCLATNNSRLVINNCGINPTRAKILEIFISMGMKIKLIDFGGEIEPYATLVIESADKLNGTVVYPEDIGQIIDEIPALALLACFATEDSKILGCKELKHKESDRLQTIIKTIQSLGGKAEIDAENIYISPCTLQSGVVESFDDHRIAMMGSIALALIGGLVNNCEVANVSNRSFFDTLSYIGSLDKEDFKSKDVPTYALFAKKTAHSLSPQLHTLMAELDNNTTKYQAYNIKEDELQEIFNHLKNIGGGANITIPYKSAIIPYLDELSEDAKKVDAVNTIMVKDKKLIGYNTDIMALFDILPRLHKEANNPNIYIVLGTGGIAKAVCYVLQKLNYNFEVVSRNISKAKDFCKIFGGNPTDYNNINGQAQALINCTPIGMEGYDQNNLINVDKIGQFSLIFDTIYNPLKTKLLLGANKNCIIANGLELLVLQGYYSRKIWHKSQICDRELENIKILLELAILAKENINIALTGFMGVGKSYLGQRLARLLDKQFIDTDVLIEKKYGDIPTIFATFGEEYFRKIEKQIILSLDCKNAIIALGGGSLLNFENKEYINKISKIVNLDVSYETITANLVNTDRPLARDKDKLKQLYYARKQGYLLNYTIFVK